MIDAKVLGNVFSDVKLCIDVACDVSWVVITVIQLRKTEREQSPQRK